MATCTHCGRSGFFLKLTDGLCDNCRSTALMEQEQAEIKAKAEKDLAELNEKSESLKAQLADQEALYQKLETQAREEALKDIQSERDAVQFQIQLEKAKWQDKLDQLQTELDHSTRKLDELKSQIIETDEKVLLQSFGFFTPPTTSTTPRKSIRWPSTM